MITATIENFVDLFCIKASFHTIASSNLINKTPVSWDGYCHFSITIGNYGETAK